MKKLTKVVAALAMSAAMFSFGACKQHDDDDDDTTQTLLVWYVWQHQEIAVFKNTYGTFSFLRNGEVKTPSGSGSYTGDPTATSGTLTLTYDGQTTTVTINGDNLEMNGSVIATRA